MKRILFYLTVIFLLSFSASGAESPKYAALTFDDGPSGRFTRSLLQGLEERDVSATFFLCGYRLEDYQELAQDIYEAGHEIGLHGYSHDSMADMDRETLRQELLDTKSLLPDGCPVHLMRPPGGAATEDVLSVSREMGLSVIFWSVDPKDWAVRSSEAVQNAVMEQIHDGAVILMHDMYESSIDAALSLIDQLQNEGYELLTLSQLAEKKGISLEPGVGYSGFS